MKLGGTVTSYASLVNHTATQLAGMKRVKSSDAANSYVVHKLDGTQGGVGGSGVRMPQGGPYLNAADMTNIQNWISSGAAP